MKHILTALLAFAVLAPGIRAQHFDMNQWGPDLGYHNAPYFRYEAEEGFCRDYSGEYLSQTDDQTFLQSEASNQQAITLMQGDFIKWINDSGNADGVTLRFSVPWGTTADVAITDNDGNELGRMTLDTEHSWEYCSKIQGRRDYKPEIYSIHVKNDNEFPRMRFDEKHCLLSREINKGEQFRIVNLSGTPVTVDFLEIEKAHKVEFQDGWLRWNQETEPNLQAFINANPGRTIYIDQDYVGIWGKLNVGDCTLQGRGMFYTELHWEQNGAGFEGFDGWVKDMYLSSYQQQRYDSPDHGPNGYGSPGKCFNGRGNAERVWVEHFECGGWLSGANGSTFRHCRIRNNYADGMNFCNSSNCLFEYSSFRNNGDDDMASWSAESYCSNNTYRYCTAEHNWRASSLGFFGGGGHKAYNLLIKDGLESGARLCSDFNGPSFGNEGIDFHDITIVHCACIDGPVGQHGDFWGVNEGALHIESSANYSIVNPRFRNIDIIDSRGNAVFIGSGAHSLDNITLEGISVDGVRDSGSFAFYFENPRGNGTINDIEVKNVSGAQITNAPDGLTSGNVGSFSLVTSGVSTEPIVLLDYIQLRLTALSWEVAGRNTGEIRDGDKVLFKARLENFSDFPLPEGYPLRICLQFDNGSTVNFPLHTASIPTFSYTIVEGSWTATAGGHVVTAILDPDNMYEFMTPAEWGRVTKRINVTLPEISEFQFDTTSGVDFQPLDLRWKTRNDSEFGKGPINTGDAVTFAAVVANTGTDDSPGGTKLGVIISPSGNEWSQGDSDLRWCDSDEAYEALYSGQVKHFAAKGGNNNAGSEWTARRGDFNVLVQVNDHANENGNRKEDNTANNKRHFALSIPYQSPVLLAETDMPDSIDHIMTGTETPAARELPADGVWHTLQGIRLDTTPVIPGIYIHGGGKVTVR